MPCYYTRAAGEDGKRKQEEKACKGVGCTAWSLSGGGCSLCPAGSTDGQSEPSIAPAFGGCLAFQQAETWEDSGNI